MLWKVVYTFLVVLIVPSAFSASVWARQLKRDISYITFCPIIDGETSVEECQQIYIQRGQCSLFEQYSRATWRNVKRVAVDAPCVRLYSARGCVGSYREITEERANGNVSNDFSSFSLCNWHILWRWWRRERCWWQWHISTPADDMRIAWTPLGSFISSTTSQTLTHTCFS